MSRLARGVSAPLLGISALLLAQPAPALASPFETTDTDVASGFEIKGLVERESDREESETSPGLDLTWAIKPEVLETSITFGAAHVRSVDGQSLSGLTDTEVAAKWRFHNDEARGLSLGVEPAVIAPTGSHSGLGDGAWRYVVPVLAQISRGETTLVGNLAYSNRFSGGEGEISASALAEREVSSRLSVGVEVAASAPTGDLHHGRVDANLGFTYALTPRLDLQAMIGRSINGRDEGPVTLSALFLEYAF